MNDLEIRKLAVAHLRQMYENGALIFPNIFQGILLHEFTLHKSTSKKIIDLAILNDSLYFGLEIKSDQDNLNRLRGQAEAYNAVFDYIVLIATHKHLDKAKNIIPEYWGIWLAENRGLNILRQANRNPNVDACSVANNLWKIEAERFLKEKKLSELSGYNKDNIIKLIIKNYNIEEIKIYLTYCIARRIKASSGYWAQKNVIFL
jgi:hypothetical protein